MSQTKSILIFGATGLIGKYITTELLAARDRGDFQSIVIFTSPGTVENKRDEIEQLKSRDVKIIVGDVTNEDDVRKAFEGMLLINISAVCIR